MSVDPVPSPWTIEREIARAGLAKLRVRPRAYQPKGVHYPARLGHHAGMYSTRGIWRPA
jgi:hypothetical protein